MIERLLLKFEGGAYGTAAGIVPKRAEFEMFRLPTEPTPRRRPAEATGPSLGREKVASPRTLRHEVRHWSKIVCH